MWEVIDTGVATAEENMRLDSELLESLTSRSNPILHFYEWREESITHGHFVKPQELLDVREIERRGIALAKRPTGGGVVFHQWDLAFSVLIPETCTLFSTNTLDNYAVINEPVLRAAHQFLKQKSELELTPRDAVAWDVSCQRFCMARPTKYDVVWEGKKIAGAAQRRRKGGFLHQGTIALTLPAKEELESLLVSGTQVAEAIYAHTFPLLGIGADKKQLDTARKKMRELLVLHLKA